MKKDYFLQKKFHKFKYYKIIILNYFDNLNEN